MNRKLRLPELMELPFKTKTCIFILGMHRSGTSVLTGVLQQLGVELGSDLMQGWADNPKGFFENNRIWKYNQEILEQQGSSWDDPFLYGEGWCSSRNLDQYREHIGDLLQDEFSEAAVFAIKDPRMCILFPLWNSVLKKMGGTSVCLLSLRHPMEVAQSLVKRNGFSIEKGLILWANHIFSAEKVSRGFKRAAVLYRDLIADPVKELQLIGSKLGVSYSCSPENKLDDLGSFVDEKLKHHTASSMTSSPVEQLIQRIYDHVCRMEPGTTADETCWYTELAALEKEYHAYYSFFMNDDLSKTGACPPKLARAEKKLTQLETVVASLKQDVDDKQNQIDSMQDLNDALKEEIKMMRETRAWKSAEKLRRFFRSSGRARK